MNIYNTPGTNYSLGLFSPYDHHMTCSGFYVVPFDEIVQSFEEKRSALI
jgi:hypothetical protein